MIPAEVDLIHMISNACLMVQLVILLLFFFSVTSWAIILIKYRYIRSAYKESAFFTDFFWKSRNLSAAFTKAKQLHSSPIARIFRTGYTELKRLSRSDVPIASQPPQSPGVKTSSTGIKFDGTENVKRALHRAINTETARMVHLVPFLATTGSATPFIGLFGTVWGIMNSFHSIGVMGSASFDVVAPGISEALVATAAGLAVAIPAVIAFNYFTQKIRVIESELQSFSADFLDIIEQDMIQVKGGKK